MVVQGPENGRRPGEVNIVRAASDRGVGSHEGEEGVVHVVSFHAEGQTKVFVEGVDCLHDGLGLSCFQISSGDDAIEHLPNKGETAK